MPRLAAQPLKQDRASPSQEVRRAISPNLRVAFAAASFSVAIASAHAADGPTLTGEQIYRSKCASCHGSRGEGTAEHFPRALVGDRTVASLSRLIAKTMPEDAPGECVGADADKVAAFIYDAFYSKAAQARNKFKPPRIEPARLTVRQYKNAVTDLLASFGSPAQPDNQHGLAADYTARSGRRRGGDNRTGPLKRLDPEVQFDFGNGSPIPEQNVLKDLSTKWQRAPVLWVPLATFRGFSLEFRVNWQGALLAPDTGEYEFVVRTENATRLYVNDKARPLIDALVKSGNDIEYRGSIYLLGGRVYPIRLEMSRTKEKSASITLLWKRPRRTLEVIPRRALSPVSFPECFVLTTPFPPDDRSVGYERGSSISRAWDTATTDAAIEVASHVATRLKQLSGATDDAKDREAKLREFCQRFAERAFRRPLTGEQKAFFIDRQFTQAHDPDLAVKRVALLLLKSPRFLYHELGSGNPDSYEVASRLSFGLWDSIPDQPLLDAAAKGELATRDNVMRQAERMVLDRRAQSKLCDFFWQWFKVESVPEIVKDAKLFSQFDEAVASDLRTSLELFLDDVIGSDAADFRQLLQAEHVYLNGRLAKFYGAALAANAPFEKVALDPGQRAGVLTHPYLMARFAYTGTTSPIHRGVFVTRSLLGRVLRPPPEAVAPLAPDLHPDLTTRQRVTVQTKPAACQTCHGLINPLGFPLEHFDTAGRYRKEEKGRPIDATGLYETRAGETVKFDGARDLAAFLAASEETHRAFVEQLFHYLVKQPVPAFGSHEGSDLRSFFATHGFNIRKLMVEIMATTALTPRGTKL
jgi:mono/diheme cytochrome c family protein